VSIPRVACVENDQGMKKGETRSWAVKDIPAFCDERLEGFAQLQNVYSVLAPESLYDLGVDIWGESAGWGAV